MQDERKRFKTSSGQKIAAKSQMKPIYNLEQLQNSDHYFGTLDKAKEELQPLMGSDNQEISQGHNEKRSSAGLNKSIDATKTTRNSYAEQGLIKAAHAAAQTGRARNYNSGA